MSDFEIQGYSIRDWKRKGENNLFLFQDRIFCLHNVNDGGRRYDEDDEPLEEGIYGVFLDDNEEYNGDLNELEDLSILYPSPGYVNFRKGAIYLSKIAGRHWDISFNRNGWAYEDHFLDERDVFGRRAKYPDFQDLFRNHEFLKRAILERRYFPFSLLMKRIQERSRIGGAICPDVAISRSLWSDDLVIMYKDKVIGVLDPDSHEGTVFSPAEYVAPLLSNYFPVTLKDEDCVHDFASRYNGY